MNVKIADVKINASLYELCIEALAPTEFFRRNASLTLKHKNGCRVYFL